MAKFTCKAIDGTQQVEGTGDIQMVMLVRRSTEYFTEFIEREAKAKGLKLVVNGSFINLSHATKIAVYMSGSARDASESTPNGEVIQEGKLLGGIESPGKFNFSQNTCGTQKFSAGMGNPPQSSCSAIGGIAPILVDGFPYGAQNVYKAGVPAGAPLTGDVDAKFKPFLTQKSNAMFNIVLGLGDTGGKTAVGYSTAMQKLLVIVQQDGAPGRDANDFRTMFANRRADNAVFLDCSDSATLYYDGKFLVKPGSHKNEYLTVAVGFK